MGHREVRADIPVLDGRVLEVASADDVFVVAGETTGIGRARAFLPVLASAARRDCDAEGAARAVAMLRDIPAQPSFEVVASFLGTRNYNRFELEDAVGGAIASRTGWRFESRSFGNVPDADLSFRVHLVDERCVFALRTGERPLHRRPYRAVSRPGSLHPPLAFALSLLAAPEDGRVALDPCAGSGTVAIEGVRASAGVRWAAFDLDPDAVALACHNARAAAVPLRVAVADAGSLPLEPGVVSAVASNPPWSRTVGAHGMLAEGPAALLREIARILEPGGRAVLLVERLEAYTEDVRQCGLRIGDGFRVRVAGAWADVLVLGLHDRPPPSLAGGPWARELEGALARWSPERSPP